MKKNIAVIFNIFHHVYLTMIFNG